VSLSADDANISRHVATKDDSVRLQQTLERLHSWSEEWLLKMNISKCKVLTVTACTSIAQKQYLRIRYNRRHV